MTGKSGLRGARLWAIGSVVAFVALGFVDLLTPGFAGDDSLWAVVRLWIEAGTPRYGYGVWEAAVPVAVRAAWIITPAVVLGWAACRGIRHFRPGVAGPA